MDEVAPCAIRGGLAVDPVGGWRGGEGKAEGLLEFDEAFARVGLDRHHGDAEFFREQGGVEPDAGGFRGIHHVEGDHGGQAEFDDVEGEDEVALEIRGIDDADCEVGCGGGGVFAPKDVDGDLLIGRAGRERVATGEVEHAEFAAVWGEHFTVAQVHCDAGVVAGFFPGSGEGVEQRGFSRIRVSHEGKHRYGLLFGHRRERGVSGDGLDHDLVGEVLADGEAGAADRADQVAAVGEFADLELFAKTHVAQAVAGGAAEQADADIAADTDLGEGHGAVEFQIGGRAGKHSELNLRN